MKAAILAGMMVLTPVVCLGGAVATKPETPAPAPYVITEDSPGWCATHSYFPCGVWPVGTPNHEGGEVHPQIIVDRFPVYACLGKGCK